jgi:hypothetical protein
MVNCPPDIVTLGLVVHPVKTHPDAGVWLIDTVSL